MSLVDEVKAYALDHYNDAFIWSALVECTTDDELAHELNDVDATTLDQALEHFGVVGDVLQDRIDDARNSAF